jgi:energy-coupling factor transporter ATP-binding protein EcfA2
VRLTRLYLRFFRSFNFDYERKARDSAEPLEWEMIGDAWYPFVKVDLDGTVTAVVGANESGKSHLIDAVKQALTGEGIDRSDFCRYSALFSVETGKVRVPDFGIELELQSDDDVHPLSELGIDAQPGQSVTLLRVNGPQTLVVDPAGVAKRFSKKDIAKFEAQIPRPFELETDVPIPDFISLDALLGRKPGPLSERTRRFNVFDVLQGLQETTPEVVTKSAPSIAAALTQSGPVMSAAPARAITSDDLARSLLLDVAKIDRSAFEDLEAALRSGQEGRVGGLIEEMNRSLARHLNFSRWWRQDRDFQLRLSPRDRELVFTIRDRTGTDYSFKERSRGLRYFLSYYVQLRAHEQLSARPEVLLMDEPDAYLSSVGQQDLLRTLENFARPDDASRADQVIYVTHSPFLINKNAAHRIRVLDKGSNEEGTRVVRDVARNHYEPLRSSVGSYVAETAFIGGANLLVEGPADQVLLTGMSSFLRRRGAGPGQLLDLNDVTIVPAGSASSVPYMAYLARGRDQVKPACVALLDGDDQGRDAAKKLARNEVDGKEILAKRYVVDIGEWGKGADLSVHADTVVTEIEDLIPSGVMVAAARQYAIHLLRLSPTEAARIDDDQVHAALPRAGGRMWKALESAFSAAFSDAHIDKVGFAKELVAYVEAVSRNGSSPAELEVLGKNFGELIADLAARLREAADLEAERRRSKRMKRIVQGFLRDYPDGANRDAADQALRDIEASLEDSLGDEAVRQSLTRLRRDYALSTDPLTPVATYETFRQKLHDLPYQDRFAYREAAQTRP